MNFHAHLATLSLSETVSNSLLALHQQAIAGQTASLQTALDHKTAELQEAQLKIQALTLELAHLRRLRFGQTSEAVSSTQRELLDETHSADIAAIEAELVQTARVLIPSEAPRARPKPMRRQTLPAHLPRIEHRHTPDSCTCQQCGRVLVQIGEDISEQLDVEPARFFVHRHIRPQYACSTCETVTAVPVTAAMIHGGLAAPSLLAWVVTSKYLDHLPLYRLEAMARRGGVSLACSTLAEWVGHVGVALQPLAQRLAELLRQRSVMHADETPVRQLEPPIAVLDYQTSRSGAHAQSFLQGWHGHLVVDDYSGYKSLFKPDPDGEQGGAWHHGTRLYGACASQILRSACCQSLTHCRTSAASDRRTI